MQQYHVKLCPPTYRILAANLIEFGKQWKISIKGLDVDNMGISVKNQFNMDLHTKSGLLAQTSVNFHCTSTSLHFQLNKATQNQPGWVEKVDCLSQFVNTTLKNAVQRLTHRMRVKFVFSPVPPSMGFLTFYLHKLLVFTLKLTSRGLIS